MNINDRVKEVREKFCGGSNLEFANKLGRNPNTTSNWVRNGYSVGRGVASEIASVFGVDLNWLMTGDGQMLNGSVPAVPAGSGVPTLAIMKITGHKLESTFLKYIRVSAEENAEILSTHPFFR